MPYFGAHMSIAGGLHLACERLARVDGAALQIFTRNQRQWRSAPLGEDEAELFRQAVKPAGSSHVAAHASYLINLANPDKEIATKSIRAFQEELRRAARLQIPFLVMHPGSHLGHGVGGGIRHLVNHLDLALEEAAEASEVMVLLETTAGQGSSLGADFKELGEMIEKSRYSERLAVCFDTCHAFAAGYDIRTKETYERTFHEFDSLIGLERLRFFHLNDSKKGLGSRIDRHEHLGHGAIGADGFRLLVNDERFREHGMVLETPKSEDLHEDVENITFLKNLLKTTS